MPHKRTVSTRDILHHWRSALWVRTCKTRRSLGACFGKTCGVSQRAIDRILQAATQSTYFHSSDRYSAYVLFSLGTKFALRPHRSGVAVFAGGMTEILADPIADCIRQHGGTITAGVP